VVLAALAARRAEALGASRANRQQMYVLGYRPAMIQQIELGANAGGTLDAITHEAITVTSQYEDPSQEPAGPACSTSAPTRNTRTNSPRLDLATPATCAPLAPRPASYALECAMDELAVASSSIRSSFACGVIRIATRPDRP